MSLLSEQFFAGHRDAVLLVARLSALVGDKGAAVTMVEASGIGMGLVDWDGPMADVWPRVLSVAATHGRLRNLVEGAFARLPAEPLFARLLDEDAAPAGIVIAETDAWLTPRLWTTYAMIDRTTLRDKLQAMRTVQGHRALLVVGPKSTGTSHTRRFLSYLSDIKSLSRVVVIDNSLRAGTPITVQELAQKIAWAVVGKEAPKFDLVAQPESVASQFHDWLTGVVADQQEPIWLVFDEFTADTATAPAAKLIHDLATVAADYRLGAVRVVICGYQGPTLTYPGAVTEAISRPTSEDVKLFFTRMSELLTGVPSDGDAIDVMFDQFEQEGGRVDERPIVELGPSALDFASKVFEAVPA